MKYLVILLLPVIFGLFIGSILSANPAFGLSCAITNMTGYFEQTDAIFLGKALSKEYQPNPRHEVTLFSVIEPYKGIYQEKIKVTPSVGPWGVNFTENSNYVVFANNNEGNLEHALCTPTQLASESNLSEIRKISQNYILPPLSQIDFGVNPNEVQCKQNLVLLQKYDGSPACVTESTKLKLIERGWAKDVNNSQNNSKPKDIIVNYGDIRDSDAISIVLDDSRIRGILESSFKISPHIESFEDPQKVVVKTWDNMSFSGNWQSGYVLSYDNGNIIEALVDGSSNSITSLQTHERESVESQIVFTQNQKQLLDAFFESTKVQEALSGLTDGTDYYVGQVRDQGVGTNSIILVFGHYDEILLEGGVDQVTGNVTHVKR